MDEAATGRSPSGPTEDASATTFFRGALAGMTGQAAILVCSLVSTVLIARASVAPELGSYGIAASIAAFITLLTGLQLRNQVARAADGREAAGYLPWVVTAGALGSAVAAALLVLSRFPFTFQVGPLAWLIPAIALQPAIDALTGLLAHDGKAGSLVVQQLLRATSRPVIVLLAVVGTVGTLDAHLIALVDSIVAATSLVTIALIHQVRDLRTRFRHRQPLAVRTLLPGVGALLIVAANWQMIQRTDLLCVGYFVGPSAAGKYLVALRLSEVATTIYGGLMVFALPLLTRARQDGTLRAAFARATVLGAQLLFPALVLLAVWGDQVVPLLFGAQYALPLAVFAVLALGLVFQIGAGPNGFVLMASRRHGHIAAIGCGVGVMNLLLNFALVPPFGVIGAAIVSCASLLTLNLAYAVAIRRDLGTFRWTNSIVRWQAAYLSLLVVLAVTPRFVFGASTPGGVVSGLSVSLAFVLCSLVGPARPVMQSLLASLRPRGG